MPPTHLCSARRHAPDPGTPAEPTQPFAPLPRTPEGQCYKCPDCRHWASLEDNAAWHRHESGHALPYLMPLDEARELADKQRGPIKVLKVRPLRKPRKMWMHHGGDITSTKSPVLGDRSPDSTELVKWQPVPVLVSPWMEGKP